MTFLGGKPEAKSVRMESVVGVVVNMGVTTQTVSKSKFVWIYCPLYDSCQNTSELFFKIYCGL